MKKAIEQNTADKPPDSSGGLGRPTLYGIPNCDTTKKAMAWLKKNKIDFLIIGYFIQSF